MLCPVLSVLSTTGTKCHAWLSSCFARWGKCLGYRCFLEACCASKARKEIRWKTLLATHRHLQGVYVGGVLGEVVTVTLSPQSPHWKGLVKGWVLNASGGQWEWIENCYSPRLLFWWSTYITLSLTQITLPMDGCRWQHCSSHFRLRLVKDFLTESTTPTVQWCLCDWWFFNLTSQQTNKQVCSCALMEVHL